MCKSVAILLEKDFQEMEAWYPYLRLREAGFDTFFVGCGESAYKGKNGYPATAERQIKDIRAEEIAGIVVPGGWAPDFLRQHSLVLQLIRSLNDRGKFIAAICHAGSVLVSAGILKSRTATSYPAIKEDMINAGAEWVNGEVVVDRNLITSRTVLDLPAFCREIIKFLGKTEDTRVN